MPVIPDPPVEIEFPPPPLPESVIARPSIRGQIVESPDYQILGAGLTDRIFLLGHADGLAFNDPYQVVDVQEAVNVLGADSDCPLLRGLLECYYAGARDIWLMAVAPMGEYKIPEERTFAWYNLYRYRLNQGYTVLLDFDLPQIVVPLHAPFYDAAGVDFLVPLAQHCQDAFEASGAIRVGLMGTLTGFVTDVAVAAMTNDTRLVTVGDMGKFVSVIAGEGAYNLREMPVTYSTPLVTAAAAELSQLPYNRGLTYRSLSQVVNLTTNFTEQHLTGLTNAKLNPVSYKSMGFRGEPFQAAVLTDNTLGTTGTDYWSLVQVRLVMTVIDNIRLIGRRYLGTIGYGQFKSEIQNYFYSLTQSNFIREFTLDINRDRIDPFKVLVDVSVRPYFGVRQIQFSTLVGPGS